MPWEEISNKNINKKSQKWHKSNGFLPRVHGKESYNANKQDTINNPKTKKLNELKYSIEI